MSEHNLNAFDGYDYEAVFDRIYRHLGLSDGPTAEPVVFALSPSPDAPREAETKVHYANCMEVIFGNDAHESQGLTPESQALFERFWGENKYLRTWNAINAFPFLMRTLALFYSQHGEVKAADERTKEELVEQSKLHTKRLQHYHKLEVLEKLRRIGLQFRNPEATQTVPYASFTSASLKDKQAAWERRADVYKEWSEEEKKPSQAPHSAILVCKRKMEERMALYSVGYVLKENLTGVELTEQKLREAAKRVVAVNVFDGVLDEHSYSKDMLVPELRQA
ncbi:hypothetical protein BJ508DRAFT_333267 [Ascobolus immersus RN42]|uniref:Uncharacterized protein n=1 Tax=Ascobolus immersus RN42 TaxID=1160509 RepID=A0A3N4HP19_ASCIM|nr:hypothetical protein BJ508DRAFT_333267 [Ascobolus immersus RN42]